MYITTCKRYDRYCALREIKRLYERDKHAKELLKIDKQIVEFRVRNKLGSEKDEHDYEKHIDNDSSFKEISGTGIKRKNTIGNKVYIMTNIKKY